MGVYESSESSVTDGDLGIVGIDQNRRLKVSIEADNVGIGGGVQYTEGVTDATITGTALMWEDGSDTLRAVSTTKPLPVAEQGTVTITGTVTANAGTNLNTSALATSANQLADGHNVTIDNASGGSSVNIQDGGNSITVDSGATFTIQEDGAALTALQKIDNTVAVLGTTTYSEASTSGNVIGVVRNDVLEALASTDNEIAPLQIDERGGLYVTTQNFISTNNSTTSTLTSGTTFTGTGDDLLNYHTVTITLDSSHNSATDGMKFQFSINNSDWDDIYDFTYTAADGARRFQFPVTARYFRVVYTNGGTGQSHFRVQTILHPHGQLTTIHRIDDDIDKDRSAQLMKSAIIAQRAGTGDFIAVQSTAAGNLKMSVQEISDGLDIGAGNAGAETQRVSIATNDVNLSAIKAAIEGTLTVDLAGNNDVTVTSLDSDGLEVQGGLDHGVVDAGSPVKVGGRAQEPTAQPDEVANDDRVDGLFDRVGRRAVYQGYPIGFAVINTSTSGNNEIVAAQAAGKKIRVLGVTIVSDGTVDCRFESAANGTALTGQVPLQAREGWSDSSTWGIFETAAATSLNLELSATINVHGYLHYVVVDD